MTPEMQARMKTMQKFRENHKHLSTLGDTLRSLPRLGAPVRLAPTAPHLVADPQLEREGDLARRVSQWNQRQRSYGHLMRSALVR